MENKTVIVERTLNAPVALVWNAITHVEEMRQWYFGLEDFRAEKGFRFEFTAGAGDVQYKHLCEVTEAVPEKLLAYSWKYDGYPGSSLVTWELEAQGDKTVVRIIHSGLESFAANGVHFTPQSFSGGWTHFADALKTYLEKPAGDAV